MQQTFLEPLHCVTWGKQQWGCNGVLLGSWCRGAAKVPVKKLQVLGNMTKGICLDRNRALETGIKTFSLVMRVVVLEN